ncbi:MAG: lipid A deacylase LpxR family protein [Steroidobacteraceae bacterium]
MNARQAATTICMLVCAGICPAAAAGPLRTIHLDDDLFSGMSSDADYTGGGAIALTNEISDDASPGMLDWLSRMDRMTGVQASRYRYELELGAAAFTPADIARKEAILSDRPYAGLVYLSGALVQEQGALSSAVTTLTLGYLGGDFVPRAQRRVHRTMRSIQPEGWHHQISDGGEATARVMHERQWAGATMNFAGARLQWLYRAGAGIGFLTDVNAGVAARWGRFTDPRWSIHSSPTGLSDRAMFSHADHRDRFIYGSVSAKVPFYNALLQGQFRDSDVTIPSDARRHFVPEVALGLVIGLSRGRDLHYFIRAQLSDMRLPERSDTTVYGGVSLSW